MKNCNFSVMQRKVLHIHQESHGQHLSVLRRSSIWFSILVCNVATACRSSSFCASVSYKYLNSFSKNTTTNKLQTNRIFCMDANTLTRCNEYELCAKQWDGSMENRLKKLKKLLLVWID